MREAKTRVAVHTHTHTHTSILKNKELAKKASKFNIQKYMEGIDYYLDSG